MKNVMEYFISIICPWVIFVSIVSYSQHVMWVKSNTGKLFTRILTKYVL